MASIRRTLSPVPRTGAMQNGEAHLVSSPLSKSSSSCSQNHSPSGGLLSSFFRSIDSCSVLCKIQAVVLGTFSQRSSRSLERSKSKGQAWKRAFLHFFISFMIGILIGLTPFVSMNLSVNFVSKHQAFSFKVIPSNGNAYIYNISTGKSESLIKSSSIKDNASLDVPVRKQLLNGFPDNSSFTEQPNQDPEFVHRKLLIIVTPTYRRPFQAYYLSRLMHTLKLVQPPLLWIVVEMSFQSAETADILRRSGVMYRHLVCDLNATSIRDRGIQQRNVALSHIETHHLDGIIHFADDDNVYSVDLLEQMREIRRFGTWTVATLTESRNKAIFKGPVCNGSQVIGWHTNERIGRFRRFHADMSGFAFNSTILWDPKRWHRPTLEPVRQLDTIKEGFQESAFVQQLVEDESQMEGLLNDCSKVMVWHLHLEALHNFYPFGWFMKNYLDAVTPLG